MIKRHNAKDDTKPTALKVQTEVDAVAPNSVVDLEGRARWYTMMRQFNAANGTQCRSIEEANTEIEMRPLKTFRTGSSYEGGWNVLGMNGSEGRYTYPNGVMYHGEIENGEFHGEGSFHFCDGARIVGHFEHGVMTRRIMIFCDGLEYTERDWMYCRGDDRRFTREYLLGLEAAGNSNITPSRPTVVVPEGYYDVGDGLCDPINETIYKYNDMNVILRRAYHEEIKWIMRNCRGPATDIVGPETHESQRLYESWPEPELDPPNPPPPAAMTTADSDSEWDYDEYEDTQWRISRRSTQSNRGKLFYVPPDQAQPRQSNYNQYSQSRQSNLSNQPRQSNYNQYSQSRQSNISNQPRQSNYTEYSQSRQSNISNQPRQSNYY